MMDMNCSWKFLTSVCIISLLLGSCYAYENVCLVDAQEDNEKNQMTLQVDVTNATGRPIPETLFGIFFEEINHAGAGGLWTELVSNRGFEAGGQIIPSSIWPWSIIGDESSISVVTDRSSCFERNKIALRMEVLCSSNGCPSQGVGVYNPGYWGMNIEEGKKYNVTLYVRSTGDINVSVSLTSSNGSLTLASEQIIALASDVSNWTKKEVLLEANGTDDGARLQLTTTKSGSIWFDQVSAMPMDTYKGHGFRNDLFQMMVDLKPRFIRFPGGCFVEGEWLGNAFRWKETVGAWEERAGHYGDVWKYWTDDGLGHFEFFQLAEDLGAAPIWVFNSGISHNDQVETASIMPFVQEALDGIEFARGDANSTWGSVRAAMGHPEPFNLEYVAVGNEDCWNKYRYYKGNYLEFYNAIKKAYPDIKIISNCDGSSQPLDHPADYYDYHVYTLAKELFSMSHMFDKTSRDGPKAFVSEYAVNITDANTGNLLAALGEAGFLLGLEKNSDVVGMVSYAPLFVNINDTRWLPDAIFFNSSHLYGTPSYWVQQFFTESSGATLLSSTLQGDSSYVEASAISFKTNGSDYIQIKAVNFSNVTVELNVKMTGLNSSKTNVSATKKKVLTSANVMDENSFSNPEMIVPQESLLVMPEGDLTFVLPPYSFSSFDLLKEAAYMKLPIPELTSIL
ncbi:alpha-L-arabinofuranosidase 2-like isoform X3 [Raphanus sativus]|uniref:non-reducing end alpha-L-arabinofuranosidase n=1 Tax=Raphanus sativus TaxID=3726 RepID=A0A9W3C6G7_RAPSA|nr:alpha-L-arabinofuranosidase 2-like isoform X3 [Raphanus sativus]